MEVVVAEPAGGERVDGGRGDVGAEAAELPEAEVVEHDQHHVGGVGAGVRERVVARHRLGEREGRYAAVGSGHELRESTPMLVATTLAAVDRWARGDLNPHILSDTGT